MIPIRRLCVAFALTMMAATSLAQRVNRTLSLPDQDLAQTTDSLLQRRGSVIPQSSNDAVLRQQRVRTTLLGLIGPLPDNSPLNPVVLGQTSLPGIRIEKILFDSQPNFHVTALLYLPDVTLVKPFPAVIIPSSGAPGGKAADFKLAAAFARNGIAVLGYDRIGHGERMQYTSAGVRDQQAQASLQPILIGESIARYLLWDAMRAVDYLQTRGEIDPARIGAFGSYSGGADVALLAALDTRIAAVGDAFYINSLSTAIHSLSDLQDAEQALPGLIRSRLDYADYVEAAAPRPYAIVAALNQDPPLAGTKETEREVRRFYSLFDSLLPTVNDSILGITEAQDHDRSNAAATSAAQNLAFIVGEKTGDLSFVLPHILKFFSDSLQAQAITPVYDEQSAQEKPPPSAFQVTPTGQVGTFDQNAATVYSLNLAHARTLVESHPDNIPYLQGAVNQSAGIELTELRSIPPVRTAVSANGAALPDDAYRSRAGELARATEQTPPQLLAGRYRCWNISFGQQTKSEGLLYIPRAIPESGAEPALELVVVNEAQLAPDLDPRLRRNQIVLFLYLRPEAAMFGRAIVGTGPWFQPNLRYLLVGKTILGRRIEDILYAIDYLSLLRVPHKAGIDAYADGHLALALLHAKIFDSRQNPRVAQLHLTDLPASYAQMLAAPDPGDISQDLLPGVLQRYDVPDLLAAIYGR